MTANLAIQWPLPEADPVFAGDRVRKPDTAAVITDDAVGASIRSIVSPLKNPIYHNHTKRVLDIVFVAAILPIVVAIIAVCMLLVALDGKAPFYRQLRVGRGGRNFNMWKLRTMVPDADQTLEAHLAANPAARVEWDEKQKLENDPRVTRIGRILRRTSLDELPQVFNVLRGDMSLVGPRPMLPSQKSLYHGRSYFFMRPGITGAWQVSARNGSAFVDRVRYDDRYWRSVSFLTDVSILLRTIKVLLRPTGM